MKGENLFLLAIVGIGVWWLFRDAEKQNELQQRALLQQQATSATGVSQVTDYAERLAQERQTRMFM